MNEPWNVCEGLTEEQRTAWEERMVEMNLQDRALRYTHKLSGSTVPFEEWLQDYLREMESSDMLKGVCR